ncbi:sensor histidine kinase [Polymorphobacter fuscus]|uniref:sensor histidine kinase n=1 Tax=Sandarakinorhabdus fusca TaxID=1439888 RepID=UPI00169BD818|nr:histidine kinase dimerization/phosphoacceptor domain -containing protein [Polymorphobacter fuscus]NJC08490.1 two-component sensor histidine kinase [Polymorphobacter fuscus]
MAAFAIALALRLSLDHALPPGFPFLTFFPAVIVTAFLAGTRPAIVCAVLSGLAAWYFFIPPIASVALDRSTAFALGFYIFIVSVDIALFHFVALAADELRREREVTARLYDRQRTMFQELQHRVANNMNFVVSLLQLQKRMVAADPANASVALEEATLRIAIMSRVHRRLYDPVSNELPIGQYFQDLCADLLEMTGTPHVDCRVEMVPVTLDIDRMMTLSLLVTEVVTNSLKHAFGGRSDGTIRLSLAHGDPGWLVLTIVDDGCGLPPGKELATRKGLGTLIVAGFVGQLGGTLDVDGSRGMTTRLVFPA